MSRLMKNKTIKEEGILLLEKGRKGIFNIVFGRTGIIIILILLQIFILFSGFFWVEKLLPYIWIVGLLLGIFVVLNIINNDDNPIVKLTWIIIMLVAPFFGILLYVCIKTDFGHRVMIKRYDDTIKATKEFSDSIGIQGKENFKNEGEISGISNYLKSKGFSSFENSKVKYFPMGEDKFYEMLIKLEQAEKFIFLEYFILDEGYMWGKILDILQRKVKEGVEVRVMYDGTCAIALLPYNYPKKLKKLGIKCKMFAPVKPMLSTHYNNRDHRKIMVIDGKYAFTGGVNIADEYINKREVYGHWKDTAIMVEGEAVKAFTLLFLQMWNVDEKYDDIGKYVNVTHKVENDGIIIPYGDSPLDKDLVGEMVYLDILNRAKNYVYIMTPYLILDNETATALCFAAERGVDVRIILPHIADKAIPFALAHTHYARLIKSGVKIYEYTPGFIHAKVFLSDDIKGVVGTINLDYRSLYHHFECAAFLYKCKALGNIKKDYINTLEKCQQITMKDVEGDKLSRKLVGKLMRIFAPLM